MSLSVSRICRAFEGDRYDAAASALANRHWLSRGPSCGGSTGMSGMIAAALPFAPVFVHQRAHCLRLHVAHHHDGGVLRPVVAVEELEAVIVLVGHVLDVFQEAHGGVLVGVAVEGGVVQHLVELAEPGFELFLLYSPSTARVSVLNSGSAYFRCLEAVGLHGEDGRQVFFGEDGVVAGEIVGW